MAKPEAESLTIVSQVMREVRIHLPEEDVEEIARLAFKVGISSVSCNPEEQRSSDGETKRVVVLEASTSTPNARRFVAEILKSPFYAAGKYSLNVKAPRSILNSESPSEITRPRTEPEWDLIQELWQFCHLTSGFCGRILIGAGLLAYGMARDRVLLMIAGLLFLPLLPTVTGFSFALLTREWPLVRQSLITLGVGLLLTFLAAAMTGLLLAPPIAFHDFSSTTVSLLLSGSVGVAAALASTDDAGRRELIGLAAAAQLAILPAWLGLALTIGTDAPAHVVIERVLTCVANIASISVTSLVTFWIMKYRPVSKPTD